MVKEIIEFKSYQQLKKLKRPYMLIVESRRVVFPLDTVLDCNDEVHRIRYIQPWEGTLKNIKKFKMTYGFLNTGWGQFFVCCFHGDYNECNYYGDIDKMKKYDKSRFLYPVYFILI